MTLASYLYLTLIAFGIQRRKSIVISSSLTITKKIEIGEEDSSIVPLKSFFVPEPAFARTLPCLLLRSSHPSYTEHFGVRVLSPLSRSSWGAKMAPLVCILLKVRKSLLPSAQPFWVTCQLKFFT